MRPLKSTLPIALLLLSPVRGWAALAIDASVTGSERTGIGNNGTATSNSFSTTSANELILAIIGINTQNSGDTVSVTGVSGAGLTWSLVKRYNSQDGGAEIWKAFAATTITSKTATATLHYVLGSNSLSAVVTIISFSGVDTSGSGGSGAIGATNAGGSASGTPSLSLTTTRNGSWVIGSLFQWSNSTAPTVGSGQTAFGKVSGGTGEYYWGQRTTSTTASSGTVVTLNDTAPTGIEYSEALCEVLPAITAPKHRVNEE